MSEIQVTGENAAELLNLAQQVREQHEGRVTEQPKDEAQKAPADEAKKAESDDKPTGLELGNEAEDQPKQEAAPALDLDAVMAEYSEKGELSEDTNKSVISALQTLVGSEEKAQALLNQFIAGQQATVQHQQQTAFSLVGGEASYREMQAWARTNLSADDKAAFDAAVADPRMMKLAVSGLYAQYQAAGGKTTVSKRVDAGANVRGSSELIHSIQQLSRLQSDPLYDRDPGFRNQVIQRLKASIDAGVYKD